MLSRSRPLFRHCSTQLRALSSSSSSTPWFVDQEPLPRPTVQSPLSKASTVPPVPQDAPQVLRELQSELAQSPHLDVSKLTVCRAVPPPAADPLPERLPQGRRRRGGTIAGDSAYDSLNGIWSWFVFAQVKEGTEGRGAVDSVVRQVRKSLLSRTPPVTLPPKSRRQMASGWAMVDGGNFAIHVLSKEAREKYFSDTLPQ